MVIYSERLRLIPLDAAVGRIALERPWQLGEALGVRVEGDWPPADLVEILPGSLDALELDPSLLGWGVWLILDRAGEVLVGDVGFKGPPDEEGRVEVGYGVLPPHRGRGFATEAVVALIGWAAGQRDIREATACSLVENTASARVLEKAGFERLSIEEGIVSWSLRLPLFSPT